MKRLPNRRFFSLIEAAKTPPIDIIRREPAFVTDYAEVLYTPGGRRDRQACPAPVDEQAQPLAQRRRDATRSVAMKQSAVIFVQGVLAGMAILVTVLLTQHNDMEPLVEGAKPAPAVSVSTSPVPVSTSAPPAEACIRRAGYPAHRSGFASRAVGAGTP